MTELDFAVTDVRPDPSAAAPTLVFRLGIDAGPEASVASVLLRCQVRIEPELRRYDEVGQDRLYDLFGQPKQWKDTLKPFLLTHVTLPVGRFDGATEVDLPVPVTYDLEVTSGAYFQALQDGMVPLIFLFSGSVFHRTEGGTQVTQIPWDREARFEMPLEIWTALMDAFFPESGWLRLGRDTIDELRAYKSAEAIPTWDEVLRRLLEAQRAEVSS